MILVPIGFDAPKMRRPYATYVLVAVCSVVWLLATDPFEELWTVKLIAWSGNVARIKLMLALRGADVELLKAIAPWTERPWTLLTSVFLHADFVHLAGNMAFLVVFGRAVDGWLGAEKFVPTYLLTGVAASLGHILLGSGRASGLLGASGAISGVMGLATAVFPRDHVRFFYTVLWYRFGTFEVKAFWALILWFAWDLVQALVFKGGGGVAFMAHVMGFVSGVVLGVFMLWTGFIARHDWDVLDWITGKSGKRQRERTAAGLDALLRKREDDLPMQPSRPGKVSGARRVSPQGKATSGQLMKMACDALLKVSKDPAAALQAINLYEDLLTRFPASRLPAYAERAAAEAARITNTPRLEVRAAERFLDNYPTHPDARPLAERAIEVAKEQLRDDGRAAALREKLRRYT